MARIRKFVGRHGRITWNAEILLKNVEKPKSATFETKDEALMWALIREDEIKYGKKPEKSNEIKYAKKIEKSKENEYTINQLIERYVKSRINVDPENIKNQQTHFDWLSKRIGDKALSDISPRLVSELRDELLAEESNRGTLKKPATVHRYLSALSCLFSAAVKEFFLLDSNPVFRVIKPKKNRPRARYLSPREINRLLRACRASKIDCLYVLVVLALTTGCRHAELTSLRWRDVDFLRKRIILMDTKNKSHKSVSLIPVAFNELKKFKESREIEIDDFLFKTEHKLSKSGKIHTRLHFDKAIKEAGIEDATFHCLRHTCASYLAMNGATHIEIANILGHNSLNMVKRYAHLSSGHLAGVLERSANTFLNL